MSTKSELECDKETANDMKAIFDMTKHANKHGLLTEVIYTIMQSNDGTVSDRCNHALCEWDI